MERQESQTRRIQEPTAADQDQQQATPAELDHDEQVTSSPLQRLRAMHVHFSSEPPMGTFSDRATAESVGSCSEESVNITMT